MGDQPTHAGLSVRAFLAILRRRLWVIVLCFIVVVGATVAFSLLQEPRYSSTATLLFRDPQLDQQLFGSTFLEESSDPAREAATNVSLVSLDVVADRTARAVGEISGTQVEEAVEVAAEGQSDLISVEASDEDPAFAAALANAFATEYIEFRRDADRQKIREAQRLVENQINQLEATGAGRTEMGSLQQRLQQLTVLASLQTGNAELVQEAQPPDSPSSPDLLVNTLLGAVVGLLLGVALALLIDRLDRRIRETDEIESILRRPVLGVVPASRSIPKEGANVEALPPGEFEAFRMIRANLRYFGGSSEVKSILVTSAESGDGKTTVAWNLAAAAASAGANVALLEADLRRPALAERLGVRPRSGLSQVLAGVTGLDDAAVQVPISDRSDGNARLQAVEVIFAGAVPPNPTDLLESERMEDLLRRLEIRYDIVFVDTPPVSAVSDAIPLLSAVDGVLVVTRLNQTSRDALGRLAAQLDNVQARTLGVVVNGLSSKRRGYGYGYGYGYGGGGQRPSQRSADAIAVNSGGGSNGGRAERDVPARAGGREQP
jgi:capsular exopolysaccharide synthesis family protein